MTFSSVCIYATSDHIVGDPFLSLSEPERWILKLLPHLEANTIWPCPHDTVRHLFDRVKSKAGFALIVTPALSALLFIYGKVNGGFDDYSKKTKRMESNW